MPSDLNPALAREQLLQSLQSEQAEQLKILFACYFKCTAPKPAEVGLMLQYLKGSMYHGNIGKSYRTISESQTYLDNQQIIAGLGELTSLCMLQLHKNIKPIITPNDKDIWAKVTNLEELCQSNAPFFFAIVQTACLNQIELLKTKEVGEFIVAMKKSNAIHQIYNLLEQSVFTHEKYRVNRGPFFNVVKSWLNLAFPFFKEHNLREEQIAT